LCKGLAQLEEDIGSLHDISILNEEGKKGAIFCCANPVFHAEEMFGLAA
jgi:hypothetical protein